jgi:hypothetical protein
MFGEFSQCEGTVTEIEQFSHTSGSSYGVSTSVTNRCYLEDDDGDEITCSLGSEVPVRIGHRLRVIYCRKWSIAVININNKKYSLHNSIKDRFAYFGFSVMPIIVLGGLLNMSGNDLNRYFYMVASVFVGILFYNMYKFAASIHYWNYTRRNLE